MANHKALDVAVAFLELAKTAGDELPSNMKLLKLLYYAQGLHLAGYHHVLFTERVVAWQYGPVVKEVWNTFRAYENQPIRHYGPATSDIDREGRETVSLVYEIYGRVPAVTLSDWTHREVPWLTVALQQREITPSAMRQYFSLPKMAASKETQVQMLCRLSAQYALKVVAIADMVAALGAPWTSDRVSAHLDKIVWLRRLERSRENSAGDTNQLSELADNELTEVIAKLEAIRRDNRSDEYGTPERFDLEVISSQAIEGIDARPHLPGPLAGRA